MFEQYNRYYALCYEETGRKVAAYNTKLKKSLVLTPEDKDVFLTEIPSVLVYPACTTQKEIQSLKQKAKKDGFYIVETISKPMAAVYYHAKQMLDLSGSGEILVIDIHGEYTDCAWVSFGKNGIREDKSERIFVGEYAFKRELLNFFIGQLECMGVLIKDQPEQMKILNEMSEKSRYRMAKNRMKEDGFLFIDYKTFRRYPLKILRQDYDKLLERSLEAILNNVRVSKDITCVLLTGSLCRYEGAANIFRRKLEGIPVTAYRALEAPVLGAALYVKGLVTAYK